MENEREDILALMEMSHYHIVYICCCIAFNDNLFTIPLTSAVLLLFMYRAQRADFNQTHS